VAELLLLPGDAADTVAALKSEPGHDLSIIGGVALYGACTLPA